MTIVYGIPNCDTIKRARAWLTEQGTPMDQGDWEEPRVQPLAVFLNGAQLDVNASETRGAKTASGQTFSFSATATDPNTGATISPSALTFSWDFGDDTTSTAAQPQHIFAAGETVRKQRVGPDCAVRQIEGGRKLVAFGARKLEAFSRHGRSPSQCCGLVA